MASKQVVGVGDRPTEHRAEVHVFEPQVELAQDDTRGIEQVVQEPSLMSSLTVGDALML